MEPRLVLTVDQLDEAVAFHRDATLEAQAAKLDRIEVGPDGMRRTRFTALV
jgi:hypothetical protein